MELNRLAEMCYHTYNTSQGQAYLAYMKDAYFDQPSYKPGMSFDHVSFLEGMRFVVDEILKLQRMYLTGDYPEVRYLEGDDDGGTNFG